VSQQVSNVGAEGLRTWRLAAYTPIVSKRAVFLIVCLGVTGTTGCSAHHNAAKQPPQTAPMGVAAGQQLTSVETVCSRVLLLHPGQRKVVSASNDGCVQAFACASGMAMAVAVPSPPSRAGVVTRRRDRASGTTVLLSLVTASNGRITAICR
jgi:hypothetical protein